MATDATCNSSVHNVFAKTGATIYVYGSAYQTNTVGKACIYSCVLETGAKIMWSPSSSDYEKIHFLSLCMSGNAK